MKNIHAINSSLSFTQSFPCSICPLTRQTRLPFSSSDIHSTTHFQLIHIDTWGPYHSSTLNGARYFLTILDDFSRATWTHLMGAKSNVFDLLKVFITMAQTQFHIWLQTVRSDNAFELDSSLAYKCYFLL
ncbi:hypothetical protein AABB24_036136 [Solanum stoloniferum]|uniref:Integrase catalytic domain-containing protein n=1 Tax=Solanum stoloniferum TaxID=62892 RepID=A0ABD2RAL8_9SOLN